MAPFYLMTLVLCGATTILAQLPTCPDEEIAFFPHVDCTKYYVCDNGLPVEQECPPPLYYSEQLGYCDFPENVPECVGGTRPPGGNTTRPTEATTRPSDGTSPTQGTTGSPGNGTTPLPNGCPVEGVDKVPNPGSCSSYFLCVNGVPHLSQCAEGLLFNPVIKECDFPNNVNCTEPEPSTTSNPLPECPVEGVGFLPYPGNCSLYIICAEGEPIVQMCAVGTCFDAEALVCVANQTVEEVKCRENEGEGLVFIPTRNSCQEYAICYGGTYKGTMKCPDGFHFDFSTGRCVGEGVSRCL